jgi:hypothetical protein
MTHGPCLSIHWPVGSIRCGDLATSALLACAPVKLAGEHSTIISNSLFRKEEKKLLIEACTPRFKHFDELEHASYRKSYQLYPEPGPCRNWSSSCLQASAIQTNGRSAEVPFRFGCIVVLRSICVGNWIDDKHAAAAAAQYSKGLFTASLDCAFLEKIHAYSLCF